MAKQPTLNPHPLLWLAILLAACMRSPTPTVTPILPTDLRLAAPRQIAAGERLTITVYVTPPNATAPLLLTAEGSFGFLPQQGTATNGQVTFTITPDLTRRAGVVQLHLQSDQLQRSAATTITPGPAIDPLLPLVGPRSIVADGAHWTMAVTTPRDRWDNPVGEGTDVTLLAQHPLPSGAALGAGLERVETQTRNLLSWARIFSRTTAGRLQISAQADEGHSPERTVLEVPGDPVSFALHINPASMAADGLQWVQIRSDQIADQYDNVLLDGTETTILAYMPPGDIRSTPAMTIDGRLYTTLLAPTRPGTMFVRAWIGAAASQLAMIDFTPGPAAQAIPVTIERQAERILITAGPLLGEHEQLVPDGTEVDFTWLATSAVGPGLLGLQSTASDDDKRGQTVTIATENGYSTLPIRTTTLLPGQYVVTVAAGSGLGKAFFTIPADQPSHSGHPQ